MAQRLLGQPAGRPTALGEVSREAKIGPAPFLYCHFAQQCGIQDGPASSMSKPRGLGRTGMVTMMALLLHWILSALSLLVVAHIVPGFEVRGFGAALLASLVIGLVNSTLGFLLKILTFPLTIITFGLFLFVINALMIRFAALVVPGLVVLQICTLRLHTGSPNS
jgi:putative membrane protein